MSTEKFQNKYRIKSARATWYDYGGGAYFITVRTKNGEHYFGETENNVMQLSEIGKNATKNLQNINNHYPYAEIPLFVVMPNHIHTIVFIDGNVAHCRDVARNVSTEMKTKPNENKNEKMVEIAKHQSLLCVVMRGLKSAVTKFANENGIDFAWQTRFFDRIIRDQEEMNRIGVYIEDNIAAWANDCYNKKNNKNDDKM